VRLAAIDIGSNSVHMVIADALGPHSFKIVDRERERVKLGEGVFRNGSLRAENMAAALHALERFAGMCRRLAVKRIVAVATSAVREANNGANFLRELKRRTGIKVKLIDGRDEAELIFRGVRHSIDLEHRRGLVLDLGGGSLEVMYSRRGKLVIGKSLPLGVRRLRDAIGAEDPLSRRARAKIMRLVYAAAEGLLKDVRRRGVDVVVATSGTQLALGRACIRRRGHETWGNLTGCEVRTHEIADLADDLVGVSASDRMSVAGVDSKRVDTIHLGALVLAAALDITHTDRFLLCEAALREGLLLREMGFVYGVDAQPHDILRASARELLVNAQGDQKRAQCLARLSTQMFECTRRLHRLPPRIALLLEVAGMLSDVGHGISYIDRKHIGYQLIRGGGLRGASDTEIEMMALAARYSVSGAPKRRHTSFAELDADAKYAVRVMAGILHVAAGLDRGRSGVVRRLRSVRRGRVLRVYAAVTGGADLEMDGASHHSRLLRQALGHDIEFVAEQA
jgi:exopolyphosphatase/guanosine-5'-triphosphate,3'-diphosphate pyrophosphatase